MPRRTNSFQRLVTLIEDQLQLLGVKVTESKQLRDSVTGEMREVDIALEMKAGVHPVIIGIECRDHQRPAPVTWIEQIHDRNQTLEGLHKTVAVSRSGFTKPALAKAERYNIATITLREAEKSDWVARAKQLLQLRELGVDIIVPKCTGARILVAPPLHPPPGPPQLDKGEETILYGPTGNTLGTVAQVAEEVLNEPAVWAKAKQEVLPNTVAKFSLDAMYRNGTYVIDAAGNKLPVSHITIEAEFHRHVSAVPLERGTYESAAVLHGEGKPLGQPMQVVVTEQEDGTTQWTVAVGSQVVPSKLDKTQSEPSTQQNEAGPGPKGMSE